MKILRLLMIAFVISLVISGQAWADRERQLRPPRVLESITMASQYEFKRTYNKSWEEASVKERQDFLAVLQKRVPLPSEIALNEPPKVKWFLSQPALEPHDSKIKFTKIFHIGFKPDFSKMDRRNNKVFVHKIFISHSLHQ